MITTLVADMRFAVGARCRNLAPQYGSGQMGSAWSAAGARGNTCRAKNDFDERTGLIIRMFSASRGRGVRGHDMVPLPSEEGTT